MTTTDKIARHKLSLLEFAHEIGNVSKACKIMGYSRQQFYEIRRNYQTYGADGLVDRLPGTKGYHPNRVTAEVEKADLDFCLAEPTKGCLAVAQHLNLQGEVTHRGSLDYGPPPKDMGELPRWGANLLSFEPVGSDKEDVDEEEDTSQGTEESAEG
jgi:hypothetical protein